MKAIQGFVGIGLGLILIASADAQAQCKAVVTKQSVKASERAERSWDIQFAVSVSGCAASSGTFEYVVELEEKGKTEFATVSETFETEKAGVSTITVTFDGPAFKDLKEVRGVKVKTCTCAS